MPRTRVLVLFDKEECAAIAAAGGEGVFVTDLSSVDLSYAGLLLGHTEEAVCPPALRALVRTYIDYGRPVFGVGHGALLLNDALGGSSLPVPQGALHAAPHSLHAVQDSLLWDLYDTAFSVPSNHRLALRRPGCGVLMTAHAPDGACEGFEHERLPLFGVTWLPRTCPAGEDGMAPGLPLYRYFLCLCGEGGTDLHAPVQKDPDVRFACGEIDDEGEKA